MNKKNINTYESEYGESKSGILRGGSVFNTYEADFYLDEDNKIVGLKSDRVNEGKIFGEKTESVIVGVKENSFSTNAMKSLHVGESVRYVIESKKYSSVQEFLNELNIVYKNSLIEILK